MYLEEDNYSPELSLEFGNLFIHRERSDKNIDNKNNKNIKNYTKNVIENDIDAWYISFNSCNKNKILVHNDVIDVWKLNDPINIANFVISTGEMFLIERINIVDDKNMKKWKIKKTHKFFKLLELINQEN